MNIALNKRMAGLNGCENELVATIQTRPLLLVVFCGLSAAFRTAWVMLHKLRRALVRPGRERLQGSVEVDEAYWGGEETDGATAPKRLWPSRRSK